MNIFKSDALNATLKNGEVIGGQSGDILAKSGGIGTVWVKTTDAINTLDTYNAVNLLPNLSYDGTDSGITYHGENGEWTISGTAESASFVRLIDKPMGLPDGWNYGDELIAVCNSGYSNAVLRVYGYDSGGSLVQLISTNAIAKFNVSTDYVGFQVRIHVFSGATVPETTIRPFIGKNVPAYMHMSDDHFQPMLTIIDDDGNKKFYTDLLPLIESKGISISSALVVGRADNNASTTMSWAEIEDAHKRGAEFLNHSYSHADSSYIANLSVNEVYLEYQKACNTLRSHGITTGDILVYCGSTGGVKKAETAARMSSCRCAFHAGLNTMVYRNSYNYYDIPRYRIESDYNFDIDKIKALIDDCCANGGWMVWMIHTSAGGWGTTWLNTLSAAIDYAIEKGLPIVSAETGFRVYGE